jgi:cytochrome o ubiquinol oxidase subunit II
MVGKACLTFACDSTSLPVGKVEGQRSLLHISAKAIGVVAGQIMLGALPACVLVAANTARAAEANLPGGPERDLLALAFYLMLIIFIPVIAMIAWFAFRYRASNTGTAFQDEPTYARTIEIVVWIVPALLIFVLGTLVWTKTHELDPYRPLGTSQPATEVQAVAQNWKWLFLYPEAGIAAVNELAFPSDRPLKIKITSDVAMNSFMIPALGGQIFAMAGMETELNLKPAREGRFMGRNMQFSGAGFPEQQFEAIAMSPGDYQAWMEKVRGSHDTLDANAYAGLMKPSIDHPVTYFSAFEPDLFHSIVRRHKDGMRDAMQ